MSLSKEPRETLRRWLAGEPLPRLPAQAEAAGLAVAAGEQGLLGLLDEAVAGAGWPDQPARPLRDAHRELLARGVQQLELAARAQRLLLDRGLRALPLKGAALAERLYGTVGQRPMFDVDLLALDDWRASLAVLVDAGFRACEAADHATSLVDPESGGRLELHHSLTSCPGFFPVDPNGLWVRSRLVAGQVPRIPAPEDILVQLALHAAFQHGLVLSLVQFLDFRRLMEREPPSLELLLESAARARAEAAVAAALEAAAIVVGARLPAKIQAAFAHHVPPALGARLQRARREPLSLVAPAVPDLARVRWGLARGRRRDLVRRTLDPPRPSGNPAGSGAWAVVARVIGLGRRWLWPAAHAWLCRLRPRPES